MSDKGHEQTLELSKAVIGCLGVIGAAFVAGIFTLLTVIGPRLPIFNPGQVVSPTVIVITPTPGITGKISSIRFAAGVTADGAPVEATATFPEHITQIFGIYTFSDMTKGTPWRDEWWHDGVLDTSLTGSYVWDNDAQGSDWIQVTDEDGLTAGQWEMRIYIGARLAAKANFVVTPRQPGVAYFDTIHFAEGKQNDEPVRQHKVDEHFAPGTTQVYAFFDAVNVAKGTPYRIEWYRDGQYLTTLTSEGTWDSDPNRRNFWANLYNDNGLVSATYTIKMYIRGQLVQMGTFVINR